MPAADRPLAGRAVLLTRPAGRSAGLARRLRALGARVSERPTIAFEPPLDPGPARAVVVRLDAFDWLVFSSATGVSFFVGELQEQRVDPSSIRGKIAAVGPGTAARLASAGLEPGLVATQSHAEGLAAALTGHLRAGDRVLWVRPEVARRALPDALLAVGVTLEAVEFYRTVPAPRASAVCEQICGGRFDVVVFTSPSTFLKLAESLPQGRARLVEALEKTAIVAIGPVTEAALRRAGLGVVEVAESPHEEAVVAAVRAALGA